MSDVALADRDVKGLGALIRAMLETIRTYWNGATSYQKALYIMGTLLFISGIFHYGVWLVQGGSMSGPISWRKPIIFGLSAGVTSLSLSWVMSFLPKHRIRGWLLAGSLGIAFIIEVFLIAMQQWRGVPSHFNFSTTFDSIVFSIMANMIILIEIIIVILTVWSLIALKGISTSFVWAIRLGLVLLVVSQIFGNLIVQNGLPKVLDFQTGEYISEGTKSAYIFGEAGSMKMPHALTLHAIQLLPLLAFLLSFTNWSESGRTRAVIVAAVGYIGMVAVSTTQTFSGLALLDLSLLGALGLAVSVILIAMAYAIALIGLIRTLVLNSSAGVSVAKQLGGKKWKLYSR